MKAELAVNPARFVNIYTCKLQLPYIAGYGTLPNEFPEDDHRHGVIIDYGTLPGSAPPLDMGHTLVHELGHYFGLFHTFQGGCAEPGDGVADTPAEASAAFGCQIGRDTCTEAGMDPINNFMDYSDDSCTNNFTTLQAERMQASIATFRPSLIFTLGRAGSVPAIEYFSAALDHYFITHVADEIAKLDAGVMIKGWTRTSKSIPVYTAAEGTSAAVCRYYIPPALGDSHFFGRGAVECNSTGQKNPSFVLEDPAFMHMILPTAGICPANTVNVYRVFSNRSDANHRYMTDKAVRDDMVGKGWLAEGDGPDFIVMCAPS